MNLASPWDVLTHSLGLRHHCEPAPPSPYLMACAEANRRIASSNMQAIFTNIRKAKARGITSKNLEEITGFTRPTVLKHASMLVEDGRVIKRTVAGATRWFVVI